MMQTENLNEMIQEDSKQSTDSELPGYMYTIYTEKSTYDSVKKDPSDMEKPATESISTNLEVIPQSSISNIPSNNFEPASEEALIAYAASIHNKVQTYSIRGYWEIGRTINSFYRGKYGTQELERISIATGIGRDTLNKMCKFARQYSRDQVEVLLSGAFYVSWFQISQNLTVEPDKLIQVYQETVDPKTFHNGIMKFKDPRDSRGRNRGTSISVPAAAREPSMVNTSKEPGETQATVVTIETVSDGQTEEVVHLRAENENLRREIQSMKVQLNDLNRLFNEAGLDIEEKEDLIDRLKGILEQVHDMVENGSNHATILSEIDWSLSR